MVCVDRLVVVGICRSASQFTHPLAPSHSGREKVFLALAWVGCGLGGKILNSFGVAPGVPIEVGLGR